jgi:hypothetical protein
MRKSTSRRDDSRRKKKSHKLPGQVPAEGLHDDQVLTFAQWCHLNTLGERTGRRILASGNGPVVVQLSPGRVGITVGNNRRWQESRARTTNQSGDSGAP